MAGFLSTILVDLADWGPRLLAASRMTLLLTSCSFAAAFVLGLGIEALRTRRSPAARAIADAYLLVLRGVPILVALYLLYFALPGAGIAIPAVAASILGLGMVYAAYLAEVFRAGLQRCRQASARRRAPSG